MRKQAGFSLAEALITLAMMSLVMGLVAQLAQDYRRMENHSTGIERSLEGSQLGLTRMSAELQQAVLISSPASSSFVGLLSFEKIDPTLARLPADPNGFGGTFDPRAGRIRIDYRWIGEELVREAAGSQLVVATGVRGFSCARLSDQLVEIRLSIEESSRVLPMVSKVYLPIRGIL